MIYLAKDFIPKYTSSAKAEERNVKRAFENKVFNKIFGHPSHEVPGEWISPTNNIKQER